MYIDRTFHWDSEILNVVGIIPYRKKWRGFLHHTFDTTFSQYNNVSLLNNPLFLESLPTCEMIYVLSNTLKIQLKEEFAKIGWESLEVVSLTHPTEFDGVPPFNYSSFLENDEKRILHVGGWLRNTLSFYHLYLPNKINLVSDKLSHRLLQKMGLKKKIKGSLKKRVLMNINGTNYHPTNKIVDYIFNGLKNSEKEGNSYIKYMNNHCGNGGNGEINNNDGLVKAKDNLVNNWNRQFYIFFENLINSVEKSVKLSNYDYDDILSKNVVFLHLIDGSAINTLNECIVRNTPIFINKHPSVVELLGENYPLFYETSKLSLFNENDENSDYYFYFSKNLFEINRQIDNLLKDPASIYNAHKYLSSLDKTPFHIETFKTELFQTFV
jgi:hypothetical protein